MKRITLHGADGQVRASALVDDEDFERFGGLRWSLHPDGYAYRKATRVDGGRGNVFLHRVIMGCTVGDGVEVDHKNRVRLDCRRENLRLSGDVGNAENLSSRGGSSRFRGVSARNGRWRAQVVVGGRQLWVGSFDDELEAAIRVDQRRREVMPFSEPDPALEAALEELMGVV